MRSALARWFRRLADWLDRPEPQKFEAQCHQIQLTDPPSPITNQSGDRFDPIDTETIPWSRGGYL